MRSIFFTIALSILSATSVSAQNICDVNRDGRVDIKDVNTVVGAICSDTTSTPDPYECVDLGLPSGTLWATCNVGASSPEGFGDYFAWGDTNGYAMGSATGPTYEWSNYKLMTTGGKTWLQINKYTVADNQTAAIWYYNGQFIGDGKTTLEAIDDAASKNWGKGWVMPSRSQMKELMENTDNENVTINGVFGRKFSSKTNPSVYIFLPAAGCCSNGSTQNVGTYGFYWMNDLYTGYTDMANMYYFYAGNSTADFGDNRCGGKSIRAVRARIN